MWMLLKKNILAYIIVLISIIPPILSVIFGVLSLPIPAYAIAIICSSVLLLLFFKKKIVFRFSWAKIFFFAFVFWIFYGGIYSESIIACQDKIIVICYVIIVPILILEVCFGLFLSLQEPLFVFKKNIYSCSTWIIWLLGLLMIFFKEYESDRLVLPGLDNPIWLTRLIAMLILVIYYHKSEQNIFYYCTILVAFIQLILVGSRTPVIALLICMGIIRLSKYSLKKNVLFIIVAIFLSLVLIVFFGNSYLFDTNFYSLYARFDFLTSIQDGNFNLWRGLGTGSFGLFYFGEDIEAYPHNCFLEFFIENGIIGVFLFVVLLFFFFRDFKLNLINLIVVYTFVNALASGDIVGNNLFYIFIYLSFIINLTDEKKNIICTP